MGRTAKLRGSEKTNDMKFNLLSNSPIGKDSFDGGSHKQLAKKISELIRDSENCRVIGIDGSWGSGKSNLVRLIEKDLNEAEDGERKCCLCEKSTKWFFFTYDAWGHQNDYPRRTILEELTSALVRKSPKEEKGLLSDDESWKKKLKELLAHKKEIRTDSIPVLSSQMVTLLVLLFINPYIKELSMFVSEKCGWCGWIYIIPAVFWVLGVVVLFFLAYKYLKKNKHESNNWIIDTISHLFMLFNEKKESNVISEQISEFESTSSQFKNWMKELDASIKDTGGKLMIIIDNMDRLSVEKVQELWAVINSLFAEVRYKNIVAIVPFDRNHIIRSFKATYDGKFGDDLINKTFDIVFRVSPPILTDWKKFFREKWKEAFGTEVDEYTLQIYDYKTESQTPRGIIAFINEFGTIKISNDSRIDDRYIAWFIFGKENISKNPFNEILNPTYTDDLSFMYSNDVAMRESISAIYYQLPLDRARDVVYTMMIRDSLNRKDLDVLKSLKQQNVGVDILSNVIHEISNIGSAVLGLDAVWGADAGEGMQCLWDLLEKRLESDLNNYGSYQDFFPILLKHVSDAKKLAAKLLKQLMSQTETFDVVAFAEGVDSINDVKGAMPFEYLETNTKMVSTEDFFALVKVKKSEYKKYGLRVDEKELDNFLCSNNSDDDLSVLPYIKEDYKLALFRNRLVELMKEAAKPNSTKPIAWPLKRYKLINEKVDVPSIIAADGIFKLIEKHKTKKEFPYYDLCCMYLSLQEMTTPTNWKPTIDKIYKSDGGDVSGLAECIRFYMSYDEILDACKKFVDRPVYSGILREITANGIWMPTADLRKCLQLYNCAVTKLDISPEIILSYWNRWTNQIEDSESPFVDTLSAELIQACVQHKHIILCVRCLKLLRSRQLSFTQDMWKDSFFTGNIDLKMLEIYHPEKLPLCYDAFKMCIKSYASGESKEKIDSDVLESLTAVYEDWEINLSDFFIDIRDTFISGPAISKEQFDILIPYLLKYGKIGDRSESLNKILPSQYIDIKVIDLLVAYKEVVKAAMKKSSDSHEFEDTLLSIRRTEPDNPDIQELCSSLEINIEGEQNPCLE